MGGKIGAPDTPSGFPVGERLESWKEIADYLKRGVRTVRRWEKEEGLPVHRHLHHKQDTIYAHKQELDAWRASRRALRLRLKRIHRKIAKVEEEIAGA